MPDIGDIVWIDLDPQPGRAQKGHGASTVRAPRAYTALSGLPVRCPTHIKGSPRKVTGKINMTEARMAALDL